MPAPALETTDKPYLLFALAGADYAAPLANVVEVGRLPAVTPLPNVPVWLLGAVAVGDELVALIDVRLFLGLPRAEIGPLSHIVLVRPALANRWRPYWWIEWPVFAQPGRAGKVTPG